MKFSASIFTLSLALSATATPLGNHALFKKHTGVPANNARRYILQSRMDAPPACVAKASASATPTALPDLNSTVVDPSLAVSDNSTVVDPTLDAVNGTVVDPTLQVPNNTTVVDPTLEASNSTAVDDTTNTDDSVDTAAADDTGATDDATADNSNSTDTRRRRRLRRSFSHISNVAHPNIVHASVVHPNIVHASVVHPSIIQSSVVHSNAVQLDFTGFAFEWQNICLQSGGLDVFSKHSPCLDFSGGITALLADADPCAQQDMADSMITFAKGPGIINRPELIDYAIRYRSHPRVPVNILGVVPSSLYCQRAPLNVELLGVVNTQMESVNPGLFGAPDVPMVPFGTDGTCPFGTVPDVSTCTCIEDPSALDIPDSGNATVLADPTVTATDSAAVDVATATDSVVIDAATATDSADPALATDDANANVEADDSTDAVVTDEAVADDSQPTATATETVATETVDPAASATSSDVNFQPDDIDGDVNDING